MEKNPDDPTAHQALAEAYAADPGRDLLLEADHHAAKAAVPVPDEPVEKRFSWTPGVVLSIFVFIVLSGPSLKWVGRGIEDSPAGSPPRRRASRPASAFCPSSSRYGSASPCWTTECRPPPGRRPPRPASSPP
ncbi:hypothetical protein FDA94_32180 [Herbidospora galbida]|uniref:Uncharacterized protein n=1 Tax=Herbidospora galbida TaxID=2575442 RepID=A0A4U3M8H9_9ACTN|nr:hypothetical protein [Herbidospora galbida]TKK83887.1 hypothetical protein FDA94_32180 [Herbidospora galbida]